MLAVYGAAAAIGLGACGDTLQTRPMRERDLAHAAEEPAFPVYWLGRSFQGMRITRLDRDPSGAYIVEYGNCAQGGQDNCVPPLRVVTSPDNSFVPGGLVKRTATSIRGRRASLVEGGRLLELATGTVVVSVFAQTPALARAAAQLMEPINQPGAPGTPLPAPLPDTHFDQIPIGEPLNADQPGAGNPLSRVNGSRLFTPGPAAGAAGAGR